MIKALFFDLDGTLLNSAKRIPDSAAAALKKCREKGMKVFLATARSDRLNIMLGWAEREYALFDGGIYCNGGCCRTGGKTEYVYIPKEAVSTCVRIAAEYPEVHLSLHMQGNLHAFNYTLPQDMYGPWGVSKEDILPLSEEIFDGVVKILMFTHDLVKDALPLPAALFDRLQAECGDIAKLYLSDRGKTIQVVSRDVGKFAAIERLRVQLGLQKEEIAVFGDDVNDIEMLQNYPCSIAMGNAVPEVKQIAAHTTKSNDEDGIAYGIEEILKLI